MDTKTRPKAPAKTYRGGQFAVQKISISRACETKLGCVLSFLENAIIITHIYITLIHEIHVFELSSETNLCTIFAVFGAA